jgi:hypothetical protein
MSPQVILVLYRSLKLAVDLLLLLPSEFHELFFSEVCQALGTPAEMLGNPILSLLGYDLGQQSRPTGSDGIQTSRLAAKNWTTHDFMDLPRSVKLSRTPKCRI